MHCIDIGNVEALTWTGSHFEISSDRGKFAVADPVCPDYCGYVRIEVPGWERVAAFNAPVVVAIALADKSSLEKGQRLELISEDAAVRYMLDHEWPGDYKEALEEFAALSWLNRYGACCEAPADWEERSRRVRFVIETAARRRRFSELFSSEVFIECPLRCNGYRAVKFLCHGDENLGITTSGRKLDHALSTLEFPENMLEACTLYFALQRSNKDYGFSGMFAPADGTGMGDEHNSIFYLFYLHLHSYRIPEYFRFPNRKWKDMTDDPRHGDVLQLVVSELCGYRGTQGILPRERSYSVYRQIANRMKESEWLGTYRESPESLLALSFKANGYVDMMLQDEKDHDQDHNAMDKEEFVCRLVERNIRYPNRLTKDEWELRTIMFLLGYRLFILRDVELETSYAGHLFAVLYLMFYRRGVDEFLSRSLFGRRWEKLAFSQKEKTAAKFRKMLIGTRNEAASKFLEPTQDGLFEFETT